MTTQNNKGSGTIEITDLTADWVYENSKPDDWPNQNPRMLSIEFHPGSANDRCVVKQKTEDGPTRFDSNYTDSQSDSRIKYFMGTRCEPFIDYSECVVSAGHKIIMELWRDL